MPPMKVHVVVNPGSGQPQPTLHEINSVFHPAGIEWDVSITHASGDGERFARAAAQSDVDVVAACGGDGTVMEVAQGIIGTSAALGVLPGGTANLMAHELGVAQNLRFAAEVIADPTSRRVPIDLGRANGQYYILRFGIGFGARQVADATRELKDRFGVLAYFLGKVQAWTESDVVTYSIDVDDQHFDTEAFAVSVVNAGNVGLGSLRLAKDVSVSDGLLDLLVLRGKGPKAVGALGVEFVGGPVGDSVIEHVQGRRFTIAATPAQPMQIDGEVDGDTPVEIEVVPAALCAVVPAASA